MVGSAWQRDPFLMHPCLCLTRPHALAPQISTGFVRDVNDAVSNGQEVRVRVMSVDSERGKFAVTMIPEGARAQRGGEDEDATGERPALKQQARAPKQARPRRAAPPVKAGDVIKGKVAGTAPFGVFVEVSTCASLWWWAECRAPAIPPAGGWVGLCLVLHMAAGRAA